MASKQVTIDLLNSFVIEWGSTNSASSSDYNSRSFVIDDVVHFRSLRIFHLERLTRRCLILEVFLCSVSLGEPSIHPIPIVARKIEAIETPSTVGSSSLFWITNDANTPIRPTAVITIPGFCISDIDAASYREHRNVSHFALAPFVPITMNVRPIMSVTPPLTAQNDEPVMKLPGRILMPCKNQTDPNNIMIIPIGTNAIFLFIRNLELS